MLTLTPNRPSKLLIQSISNLPDGAGQERPPVTFLVAARSVAEADGGDGAIPSCSKARHDGD